MQDKMSPEMYRELAALRSRELGSEFHAEIVPLDAQGYARNGRYFGTCAKGERIHRVDTDYGTYYVRSRATSRDLERFLRCPRDAW